MTSKLSRRHALGLGLGAVAMPALLRGPAQAQGGRVVVGTWGGDYARLLAKNIEDPLLKPKGFEVAQDQASDSPRRTKMVAEKRLPRGTSDIQGLSAAQMFEMNEAGVVETIDYSKMPNAKNLMPSMKYPYGVGHIYSGKVILYNPKIITTPPTSFADALDPKHGNKLGIIDIQYPYTMMAAGLASGGSMTNYEPGKERLMACRKAGARILPTNEAMAQALQNEEVGICIMWKARAVQWQKAGAKVDTVAPKVYDYEQDGLDGRWADRTPTDGWFVYDAEGQYLQSHDPLAGVLGALGNNAEAAQHFFSYGPQEQVEINGKKIWVSSRMKYLIQDRTWSGSRYSDEGDGLGRALEAATTTYRNDQTTGLVSAELATQSIALIGAATHDGWKMYKDMRDNVADLPARAQRGCVPGRGVQPGQQAGQVPALGPDRGHQAGVAHYGCVHRVAFPDRPPR